MPTYQRIRQWKRHDPPTLVVMTGVPTVWSEAEWSARAKGRPAAHPKGCRCGCARGGPARAIVGRKDCPAGCAHRDLAWERRMGFAIICIRCLTHSDDPDHWSMPVPLAVALADRKARAAKARAASFAQMKYAGRKSARKVASG